MKTCRCTYQLSKGGVVWEGKLASIPVRAVVLSKTGHVFRADEVYCVWINQECPVEMLDLAISSGYWVLGMPRRDSVSS